MTELREDIAEQLRSRLTAEQLAKLMDEVLSIEKRVSAEFKCKSCGQRQMSWGTVLDSKAVVDALVNLANQAWGRPSEASEKVEPIIFKRLVKLEDDDGGDS